MAVQIEAWVCEYCGKVFSSGDSEENWKKAEEHEKSMHKVGVKSHINIWLYVNGIWNRLLEGHP